MDFDFDNQAPAADDAWICQASHPFSGIRFEVVAGWARATRYGHEIISPSRDNDAVYREYTSRVNREIEYQEELQADGFTY